MIGAALESWHSHAMRVVVEGLFVFLYLLPRCMRPEGPWQRLATALADSSAFLTSSLRDQILSPTTIGRIGQPYLLLPNSARQRKG